MVNAWSETGEYLESLKESICRDVRPLLDVFGAAPFAINREVLSYVDHLGHLYSGRSGQVGERSRDYLKQVMARVDPNYAKRAAEIYLMYRCGLVHEFTPKALEDRKGRLLEWYCYKGPRHVTSEIPDRLGPLTHLEPLGATGSNLYWLPVSTSSLIDDLVASIDIFRTMGPEDERVTAWNRAARELNCPEPFDFALP